MNLLYTVTDSNYFSLTCSLLHSVVKNESAIDKIAIGSVGLTNSEKIQLNQIDRSIDVIDLDSSDVAERLHDDGWVQKTRQKTIGLLALLKEGHRVFMVDADCLILRPFVNELSFVTDIGVVRRIRPAIRADLRLDYIASFFVGDGNEAVSFVESWIDMQNQLIRSSLAAPYETPALCRTIRYWNPSFIDELDESIFSRQVNFDTNVSIAHLKSNSIGQTKNILNDRLANLSSRDRDFIRGYY